MLNKTIRGNFLALFIIAFAALSALAVGSGPITVDIPVSAFEDPTELLSSWSKCLGNYQGGFPQYCNWLIATGASAYDTLWVLQRREGCGALAGNAEKRVTILEFNISSIPDTAYISDVSLILQVDSIYTTTGVPPQIAASDMMASTTKPSERLLDATNLTDALGGNLVDKDYFYGKVVNTTGEVSVHLNTNGLEDFRDQLSGNWFAMGLYSCEFTESSGKAFVRLLPRAFQKIRVTYYSSANITIRTDFDGGELTLDDTLLVASPYIAPWFMDELHIINTDSVQTPGLGVKYLWRYWSDGGTRRHTIHINPDTLIYTAYFDTMFQLVVYAPGYSDPSPTHPDSVWFDPRTWAFISIDPCTAFIGGDSLERHIFQGWQGVGSGSYTGPSDTAWVRMDGPVSQYAVYDTAYWLELSYTGCGTGVPAQIGDGWAYVHDSVDVITAESLLVEGAWYYFKYWSNSAGHLRDSTRARTWFINPDMPRTIVANYEVDPQLEVYPNEFNIVAPGNEFLLPAIIDASLPFPVDSFRFTMRFNSAKLEFVDLIMSSVLWSRLTSTPGTGTVSVFGDVPGSVMAIDVPETLFYYRMRAKLDAEGSDTIRFDTFQFALSDADTRPGYVQIVPTDISVVVTTDYGGDSVWIDGSPYPAPYSETWIGAEIRRIGADSLNPISAGEMARFVGWSDGGARFHNVQPISDTAFTAEFDTLLYLDVVSPFGTPSGSGWFDRGELRTFSVAPNVVVSGLSRDIFVRWEGEGTGSYSGTSNPSNCTMTTPITETAIWQNQHWLELSYTGTGVGLPTLTGEGWANNGAWAPISADSTVLDGAATRFFAWWSGGTVANRFIRTTEAFVSRPDTIVAVYSDQPFVFNFDLPETTTGLPSENISIPVAIDIPTSTVLSEIAFHFYFEKPDLSFLGITTGDLPWSSLTATDLSSGIYGHIYIHANASTPIPVDPADVLAGLSFALAPTASGESRIIASDGGFDVEIASPDTGWVDILGQISVIVTTEPYPAQVFVDSSPFSAPYEALWSAGESHDIGVTTPQYPSPDIRMNWAGWSDAGAREHSVEPVTDTVFSAQFNVEYRLSVISAHGITTGSGWFASGSEAVFDVSPDSVHEGASYYLFDGWLGTGDAAYTGPARAALATINEPCTETAQWRAFHELTLDYTGTPIAPILSGGGWLAEGAWAPIQAQDSIIDGPNRYYFVYWSGEGAVENRLSSITNLLVDGPRNITAVYSTTSGGSLFGPPAVTHVVPGEFVAIPIIYYGSARYIDSLAFSFDFDPSAIMPHDILPAGFDWDHLEIEDDGHTARVFARDAVEFAIEDGDTLLFILLYISATSGSYNLEPEAPEFDLSSSTPLPGQLRVSGIVVVTIRTDFGGKVVVDGVERDSPFNAEWPAGSEHLVAVPDFQTPAEGHRRYYTSWSDGGLRSHYISPVSDSTFTAIHSDKFFLSAESPRGSAYGSGWFESGAIAPFGVTPETVTVGDSRFVFDSWAGTGAGSYTGRSNPHSVSVSAPITETAFWAESYYLRLASTGTGGFTPLLTGSGWFDRDSWAPISAEPILNEPSRSLNPKAFSHWTGGVFADSTQPSTTALVDAPRTATAVYTGTAIDATDSLWTAAGEVATIEVRAISDEPLGLDTLEMSLIFGGGCLSFRDVVPCGIAWDHLSATSVDLGGGVIRVNIVAQRESPFMVEDFDLLFCVRMDAVSPGNSPFELAISRVHSAGFRELAGERAVIVSNSVELTLASAEAESLYLDGAAYSAGSVIPLAFASPHIASAPEIVPIDETSRYNFETWNDSPDREREIRPISDTTITAEYSSQFLATVFSSHGSVFGGGWFDEGDSAVLSVSPESVFVGDSILYAFAGWSGDFTGTANPCTLLADSPKAVVALWDTLYRVRVSSAHGEAVTDGWCARGDSTLLRIRPTLVAEGLSRWAFTGWEGIGLGSYTGTADSIMIHPLSPISQTAQWNTQFMVRVYDGGRGTVYGGGWFDEGATAFFGIAPPVIDSTAGIRWVFAGWNGEGEGAYSGADADAFCTVDGPIDETAAWTLEYFLAVDNGGHGVASGEGWYSAGSWSEFSVEPDSEMITEGVAWRFTGWMGFGEGSYTGENNPATCRMSGPVTERAIWGVRYRVAIADSGAMGLPEFEGEGWFPRETWQPISAPPVVIFGSSRLSFLRWSGGTFDDTTSSNTNVYVDTTLNLIAHYSDFEVSPPAAILVEAGDTFDVPITMYYPFGRMLMNMQFNLHHPASVNFISVRADAGLSWGTLTAIPLGGGTVTIYGNRSPSLVYPPVVLCIAKFVSTGSTARIDTLWLDGFTYDVSGANSNPGQLVIGAPINVIVRTDYTGEDAKVWIDGVQCSSPYSAVWIAGEPHNIGAFAGFGSGDTRAVWRSWSDGGAIHHTVAPMLSDTFTAHYAPTHILTINAPYGGAFGGGFHDEGELVEFGIAEEVVVSDGTEWTFTAWAGSGDGHYSGAENPAVCTMNGPIVENAIYSTRYYLTVDGVYSPTTGQGWYSSGLPAEFSVTEPIVAVGEGTRRAFDSWIGAYTGTANPATWTVTRPNTQTARWNLEHLLTIDSPRGVYHGDGWHLAGSTVEISIETTVDSTAGIRWAFAGWQIGDSVYTDNPLSVNISGPKTAAALWRIEYRLEIASPHGAVYGSGWFPAGAVANFFADPETVLFGQTRFIFEGWSGDYSGDENPHSITMTSPAEITAIWKTQHLLTVVGGPSATAGAGWFDEGSNVIFSVVDPIIESAGLRNVFSGWGGFGLGSYSGAGNPAGCTMNGPIQETALWNRQYFTLVQSDHGTAFGTGFNPAGTTVEFGVGPTSIEESGARYNFTGWLGLGPGSYTGLDNPAHTTPDSAIEEFAQWDTLYELKLSAQGAGLADPSLFEEGFYYAGNIPIAAQNPVYGGGIRYHFRKWTGGTFADSLSASTTIALSGPDTAIAVYSAFEVSPRETTICSVGDTAWIPIILHSDEAVHMIDTLGFDLYFDGGFLTYLGIREDTHVDWTTTLGLPISRSADTGIRIRAYSATPIAIASQETLLSVGLIVAAGDHSASPILVESPMFDIAGAGSVDGVLFKNNLVSVTVRNSAFGDSVLIDGIARLSPYIAEWLPGDSHTIAAKPLIPIGSGSRARFDDWDDSDSRERVVWAESETTFTANHIQQYSFTVFNSGGDSPVPPVGSHWFDDGAEICAFVQSPDPISNRYCTGFSGTGDLASGGTADSVAFNIGRPTSIYWNWQDMIPLIVVSAHGAPWPPVGTSWFIPGAAVSARNDSLDIFAPGQAWICSGWTGTGSPASGSGCSVDFNIEEPSQIEWNFAGPANKLDLASDGCGGGAPELLGFEGYYDRPANIVASSSVEHGASKYFFDRWISIPDGADFAEASDTATTIDLLGAPRTAVAVYRKGVKIDLFKSPAQAFGGFVVGGIPFERTEHAVVWVPSCWTGQIASSAEDTATGADSIFVFDHWSDGGARSHEVGPLCSDAEFTAFMSKRFRYRFTKNPNWDTYGTLRVGTTTYTGATSADLSVYLDEGAVYQVTASEIDPIDPSRRLRWVSWSDTGARAHNIGPVTGTGNLTANYQRQFLLEVKKNPVEAFGWIKLESTYFNGVSEATAWYDLGATANIEVSTPDGHADTLWNFMNWSVGPTTPAIAFGPIDTVYSLVANYRHEIVVLAFTVDTSAWRLGEVGLNYTSAMTPSEKMELRNIGTHSLVFGLNIADSGPWSAAYLSGANKFAVKAQFNDSPTAPSSWSLVEDAVLSAIRWASATSYGTGGYNIASGSTENLWLSFSSPSSSSVFGSQQIGITITGYISLP